MAARSKVLSSDPTRGRSPAPSSSSAGAGRRASSPLRNSAPPLPALVRSDEHGRFLAVGVGSGSQPIVASARPRSVRGRCEVSADTTTSLRIELTAGATVRGVVRDAAGHVVSDAEVSVGRLEDFVHSRTWTSTEGLFELVGLPAADVEVRAEHDEAGRGKKTVHADAGAVVSCDLVISRGLELKGRVDERWQIPQVLHHRDAALLHDGALQDLELRRLASVDVEHLGRRDRVDLAPRRRSEGRRDRDRRPSQPARDGAHRRRRRLAGGQADRERERLCARHVSGEFVHQLADRRRGSLRARSVPAGNVAGVRAPARLPPARGSAARARGACDVGRRDDPARRGRMGDRHRRGRSHRRPVPDRRRRRDDLARSPAGRRSAAAEERSAGSRRASAAGVRRSPRPGRFHSRSAPASRRRSS